MSRAILNGDHLAFEQEHANTPLRERPDWPLPSFDAKDWADDFCRRFLIQKRDGHKTAPVDDDVGLMIAWFANALMRGYDEQRPTGERGAVLEDADQEWLVNTIIGCFHEFDIDALGRGNVHRLVKDIVTALQSRPVERK